ncbi:FecR family protein [Draconibacterium sediminis]|uniref:FecR family protein n=1 Tax=Draconibacterium sediminis TaxID=1544798 RepID=UPI0026F2A31A|nr:FecR family protein [Draconibacterium sediminis]
MKDHIINILDKGRARDCNFEDVRKMFNLFLEPEKEYDIKQKLFNDLLSEPYISAEENLEIESLYRKTWSRIRKQERKYRYFNFVNNIPKIAAVLLIGLITGVMIYYFYNNQINNPIYYSVHAPRGSISEAVLPDSSLIILNSDSRIRYSIDGESGIREVFLEGEAWFDVAKNRKKPFVVHTPFYDVNVVGTQFNVKAYDCDNYITTTLEEGQIILESKGDFKLAEDVVMKPGEQAVLRKDLRKLTIKEVNTKWYSSWKDNRIIIVNMNFSDLVILLERKFGVDIEVKNQQILNLHFDGIIKNESIIEVLKIIENTLPINYQVIGQKIEITSKN